MKDKSKRLTVVNTGKKPSEKKEVQQIVVQPSSSSSSHAPGFNPNLYLLKSVWDSVFEIKTDGSGQKYIFGKLPVVTKYGITMYADDGNVDIPQLAEGLPFDQRTIWFNPETKQIEVIGGTGGGVADSVLWDNVEGKPSWITDTKPKYSYSEIEGTPDLSVYVTGTALSNTLSDYATLTYLTGELKKYVTIKDDQDIVGVKNFVNGLKIGGMPITKKQDDVVYLDANLVVRGGITMYAENEVDIPSIIDSLPIANANIQDKASKGIASFDSAYFKVTDGWVTLTSAPSSGASSLGELLNVDASIDATASVDRVLYQPAGSAMWVSKPLDEIMIGGGGATNGEAYKVYEQAMTSNIDVLGAYKGLQLFFNVSNSSIGSVGIYDAVLHVAGSSRGFQLRSVKDSTDFYVRNVKTNGFTDWNKILHSGNYSSYTLPWQMTSENVDECFNFKLTSIYGGSNCPSAYNYGILLTLPFRTINSNSKADFGAQIFIPNGDDASPHMYYRTAHANSWDSWKTVLDSSNYSSYALPLSGGTCRWINIDFTSSLDSENSVFIIKRKDRGRFIEFQGAVDYFKGVYNFTHTSTNVDIHVFNKGTSYISALQTGSSLPNMDISGCSFTIGDWQGSKFYFDTANIRLGIGTPKPSDALHVNGSTLTKSIGLIEQGEGLYRIAHIGMNSTYGLYIEAGTNADSWQGTLLPIFFGWRGATKGMILDGSKNLLVYGGITMYSDQRKKTILNHVELSLKQIADAPLIEHYYNSDQEKTTHVGSIAQYWASLNDWFCKLDAEGFYTMEIQNCALASAISIARHLEKYESKTDKKIRMLKKRITELEDKLEKLEGGNYGCN